MVILLTIVILNFWGCEGQIQGNDSLWDSMDAIYLDFSDYMSTSPDLEHLLKLHSFSSQVCM